MPTQVGGCPESAARFLDIACADDIYCCTGIAANVTSTVVNVTSTAVNVTSNDGNVTGCRAPDVLRKRG